MSKINNDTRTLFQLIHDYLIIYLPKQRRASPNTIDSCRTALNQLLDFMVAKMNLTLKDISFESLTRDVMMAFLDYLTDERNASAATRNQRLACIRGFIRYASARNPELISLVIELSTIPLQKDPTNTSIEHLSENAMQTLLMQPDTTKPKGVRDQFFMVLMYDTAARIQEMIDVRICDIHPGKTPTITLTGKGSKTRIVPLMEKTMKHFDRYMALFHAEENLNSKIPLFYVIRKQQQFQISDDAVRRFLNKYAKAAHAVCNEVPEKIHPHIFRHSRAMHLYQRGMDLTLISQWLGHASLQSTLVYAHADTEQKRMAIELANGDKLLNNLYIYNTHNEKDKLLKKMYGLL